MFDTHLRKNILDKCLMNLNVKQKNLYNTIYHNRIRNLTRFTYPETINARESLFKKRYFNFKKRKCSENFKNGSSLSNAKNNFMKRKITTVILLLMFLDRLMLEI